MENQGDIPKEQPQQIELGTTTFEIKYLSKVPTGFEVRTQQSLLRHEPNTPLPFAERIARERAREKKQYRVGEAFAPKVGIRNVHLEGNELVVDVMPVTFPTYKAISEPDISQAEREISNPSATSLILLTTEDDGSHKFVIQHRSLKNFFYGDIPGASVAGYLDGHLQTTGENRGKIDPLDTKAVKGNGTKEMLEEIGLYPRDITDLKITGFASDKVRIHDEFLLLAKSKLSSQDILFRSGLGDHFRFIEQAMTIDANIETIEKLLTQVKCPVPPTHQAAFVAAGYSMLLEETGQQVADEWKAKIQEGINRNYTEIDEIVKKYYEGHPEELNNIPEGKPKRNPSGYEPAYTPQQQGLPDMESEFDRFGLANKELGKVVDEALIFDVDGVLTVPDERLFDREVMEEIAQKLKRGGPVILNTGRSISWLQQKIVARLYFAHNLTDKAALQNLFMIGEKGGTWMGFDEEGMMDPVPHRDGAISVPDKLQTTVRKIVEEEFADTMFYDHTKQTMISVEQREEISLDKFKEAQKQLVERLIKLVEEERIGEDFEIDPTTIATDIQNKHVGKDFAVQRAVAWLKQRGILPKKYITFGDSSSDFAMAKQLHEEGMNVEHIHVGESDIPDNLPYPVTRTQGKYNNGTKEFLSSRKQ